MRCIETNKIRKRRVIKIKVKFYAKEIMKNKTYRQFVVIIIDFIDSSIFACVCVFVMFCGLCCYLAICQTIWQISWLPQQKRSALGCAPLPIYLCCKCGDRCLAAVVASAVFYFPDDRQTD